MMESNGFRDCESIRHSVKKRRHSSMDAGIQLQGERSEGFEIVCSAISFTIIMLPSLALDSGIHARMTALKIITPNNAYLLWLINIFTVSLAIGGKQLKLFYSCVFF